jgi:hypothetical protein
MFQRAGRSRIVAATGCRLDPRTNVWMPCFAGVTPVAMLVQMTGEMLSTV